MHKLQFSPQLTVDPRNQRQHLPPLPSADPFVMQPLLESRANTMPLYMAFNGLSLRTGVVNQEMAQQNQHQYRTPSSGPSRNQRTGSREAEAQHLYNRIHESSGSILRDRSTGIYPSHARIDASDNTRAGKRMRTKPYNRDRSSRKRRRRTDKVDSSEYEILIVGFKRGAMAGGPKVPTPALAMLSTWTTAPAPSTPALATSTFTVYATTIRNTNTQKQPVEEDDFDTISLGSGTE